MYSLHSKVCQMNALINVFWKLCCVGLSWVELRIQPRVAQQLSIQAFLWVLIQTQPNTEASIVTVITFPFVDIDECNTTSPCEENCTNTAGSYQCSCGGGRTLSVDDSSCLGEYGPLTTSYNFSHVKLQVAHALGMSGIFSPPQTSKETTN